MKDTLFTVNYDEFSKGMNSTNLLLYAGIGLAVFVLFNKDPLNYAKSVVDFIKSKLSGVTRSVTPLVITDTATDPKLPVSLPAYEPSKDELFFTLIESWKKTRDLAVKTNCTEAVKVADQMFPFLSPNGCKKIEEKA
jgi:hypothetical protein